MRQTPFQRRLAKIAAAYNHKARKRGVPGKVTAEDLARTCIISDWMCTYCGVELTQEGVSFDHVVPMSGEGGNNYPENIVACCITCQRTKFTKSPEELAEWRKLIRNCKSCGIPFRPRWADYKRGFGWYHSRVCSGKAGGLAS